MIPNKIKKLKQYKFFLNEHAPIGILRKSLFGLIKFIYGNIPLYAKKINAKNTDVDILLVCGYEKEIERTKKLYDQLIQKGFRVECEVISKRRFLLHGLFNKPKGISSVFLLEATESNYIVQKYQPKILITFTHNSIISSFFRDDMSAVGGKYINIAHAVLGSEHQFSMFDFDYYFIYGQSSLENIKQNNNRFGSTRLIKTGSIFFPVELSTIPYKKSKNVLFFSTWLPDFVRDILVDNANIVIDWAKEHPDYTLYIKMHHLEDPEFIKGLATGIKNIVILDKSVSMIDALTNVSIVLTSWSNASIEAASANRPVVVVNNSDILDNYLHFEKYFLQRCKSTVELHNSIEKVLTDYEYFIGQCEKFTSFHLEYQRDSLDYIVYCIEEVYSDREVFDFVETDENFNLKKK